MNRKPIFMHTRVRVLAVLFLILGSAPFPTVALGPRPAAPGYVDIELPSTSTGLPTGTLAVRVFPPGPGLERYAAGAPIVIWVPGGPDAGTLNQGLGPGSRDMVVISFLFPGGTDHGAGRSSDGVYDYRGEDSIQALADVARYAAGDLTDSLGRTINDVVPATVLHDNVGFIGLSNGGNVTMATAALHGSDLAGHLRYIVQWESPVSSQIVTADLGGVILDPATKLKADYVNPRYLAYGAYTLTVGYADLAYNPDEPLYPVFHDGNGDGAYTTVLHPVLGVDTPDLNLDDVLDLGEDFPVATFYGVSKPVYSRPVAHALLDQGVFTPSWPVTVATPTETDVYWDLREAVQFYGDATTDIPDLEGMVLASVDDHVQSSPEKPHIRQAFDGWNNNGAWVQLNPSPAYMVSADPSLAGRSDLPNNLPNAAPGDWGRLTDYCVPDDIINNTYQLAAVWQMADRAQGHTLPVPAGAEQITFVDSPGIGRIAVRLRLPNIARYPGGAPVVVHVATFFTPGSGFGSPLEVTEIGALQVSYLWPGERDARTGASSEGTFDYGGPDCLAALRDVIGFASGSIPNSDGIYIADLLGMNPVTSNVGLYAFSHPGIAATNVLAHHGASLTNVKYFVGRENPTVDALSSVEAGHWRAPGVPVLNPYYTYPDNYAATALTIDYSTVGWLQNATYPEGRPYFAVTSTTDYILGEKVPQMWDKRYYSISLTQGLADNGALALGAWPTDLATITETVTNWPYRTTVFNYPSLAATAPDLGVMLVFAREDHIQPALDKPHVHQAYQGFRDAARLWVRMNPDRAYVAQITTTLPLTDFSDNNANTQPGNWLDVRDWAYRNNAVASHIVPLAAVAEMADRAQTGRWEPNLEDALVEYPPVAPTPTPTLTPSPTATMVPHRLCLPLAMKGAREVPHEPLRLPHDVDRLPSGNTLITAGDRVSGRPTLRGPLQAEGSRVLEVDGTGNVVWEISETLDFAHNTDLLASSNLLISDTGNDRVIEIDTLGQIIWTSDAITLSDGSGLRYPNDANWLAGDHLLITDRNNHRVIEIDRTGNVVWQFGETGTSGNGAGHLNGPHNADRLGNGNTIVADSNNNRIIEVALDGAIAWTYQPTGSQALDWPRDADRLANGNTLIVDSYNNRVVEVTSGGTVAWEYGELRSPYDADRLGDGHTLIADSSRDRVIELDDTDTIVWQYPPAP